MEKWIERYKGIHPGIILARELKKRSLRQRPFALSVAEHPQTFNAITKGKRSINTALSLKIEKVLQLTEGTLLILQAYYEIRKEKEKQKNLTPDLSVLRKSLFWDTDIKRINWEKQYRTVIQRVFERGNEAEKNEIIRFYGKAKIQSALQDKKTQALRLQKNVV